MSASTAILQRWLYDIGFPYEEHNDVLQMIYDGVFQLQPDSNEAWELRNSLLNHLLDEFGDIEDGIPD